MFSLKLLHFVEGYIKFEGHSQSPNTFMNCLAKKGLNIWGLFCDKDIVSGYVIKSQFELLNKIALKTNTTIDSAHKYGLPFLLKFLKNRKGIIFGTLLFFLNILFLSNFLWSVDIKIDGNLDEKNIEKTLSDLGVKNGAYLKNIDTEMIEKEFMLRQSDVSWVAINLTGSVANVELSEKIAPPKNETDETPCNLVATDDGQIIKSEVISGQKEFQIFQAVVKGNLLVNGIIQKENAPMIYKHSKGKVYALVRKNPKIEVPFETKETVLENKKTRLTKIEIFNLSLPLSLSPKPNDGDYEKEAYRYDLKLFNTKLPVSVIKNIFTKKEEITKILSKEEAEKLAREKLQQEIQSMPDTKVISNEESFETQENKLILNANLLLEKNIAQEAPLAVNSQN